MPSIRSYRDLKVWQAGVDLVVASYRLTDDWPDRERYGLISQTRRAAVSIPANIAEGHGRDHLGDYLRFLSIANSSLMELETYVIVAERLGYIGTERANVLLESTATLGKMLAGLSRNLKVRLP